MVSLSPIYVTPTDAKYDLRWQYNCSQYFYISLICCLTTDLSKNILIHQLGEGIKHLFWYFVNFLKDIIEYQQRARFLFLFPWNIICKQRENSEEGTAGKLAGNVHRTWTNMLQCESSPHYRSHQHFACVWITVQDACLHWRKEAVTAREAPGEGEARVTLQIFKDVPPCNVPIKIKNIALDNSKGICHHN